MEWTFFWMDFILSSASSRWAADSSISWPFDKAGEAKHVNPKKNAVKKYRLIPADLNIYFQPSRFQSHCPRAKGPPWIIILLGIFPAQENGFIDTITPEFQMGVKLYHWSGYIAIYFSSVLTTSPRAACSSRRLVTVIGRSIIPL